MRRTRGAGQPPRQRPIMVNVTDPDTGEVMLNTAREIAEANDTTPAEVCEWVSQGGVGGGAAPFLKMEWAV